MVMHELILKFIKSFIDRNGYAPSIREIQDGCGVSSTSVVSSQLDKLEDQGKIKRAPYIARGIVVSE